MYEYFVFIDGEHFAMGRKTTYEEVEQSGKDIEQEAYESTRTS